MLNNSGSNTKPYQDKNNLSLYTLACFSKAKCLYDLTACICQSSSTSTEIVNWLSSTLKITDEILQRQNFFSGFMNTINNKLSFLPSALSNKRRKAVITAHLTCSKSKQPLGQSKKALTVNLQSRQGMCSLWHRKINSGWEKAKGALRMKTENGVENGRMWVNTEGNWTSPRLLETIL